MRNSKVQFIVHAAMIAAIYVVLTYFISAFNLASGAIQVRISEARFAQPRGADHSAVLYTGGNSGTVCGMSACQPSDGSSHL